ncbi:MAG TPA: hypothetical protein VGA72_14825, partial [Anaerolineales bacterium]
MKSLVRILLTLLVLAGILTACDMSAATPSADDVVNTAVAGTQQAQALAQATVNASVLTAMPATPTSGPTVEYVSLTEEELTALIDEAVTEAIAATEQTTTAVTSTTSDATVTSEEVVYLYDYYYYADYYVEYAEDLLNEYYNLYADLAEEMIVELNAIESELSQMNETLSSIDSSLQEISGTLEQGLAVAEETIAQLETAAQTAQTNAQELKAQAQDMMSMLQLDQEGRLQDISQIQPNNIPTDRISSLQTAFEFLDTAKLAMGDNKLSRVELIHLAQLGANAQAGFQNFGGPGGPAGGADLSQFNGKFSEITGQFARGQMPQARGNVETFERSLGSRPNGPGGGGPGGGLG